MSLILKSGNSSALATIDSDNRLLVNLPTDRTKAGFVRTTSSSGRDIETTENGYLRTSAATLVCYDQIEGNAINTNLWNPYDTANLTIAQANGFITINSGSVTTANAYGNLKTLDVFPLYGSLPLLPELTVKTVNLPQSGVTAEIGCLLASAGGAPSDGCYFRWGPTGAFTAIINYGGVETTSGNLAGPIVDDDGDTITLPPSNLDTHLYIFEIVEDQVIFSIDDIEVATVQVPAGQAFPFNNGRQSIGVRMYWTTSPATAPQISLGQFTAKYEDLSQLRSWPELMAVLGKGGYQSPVTPFGQTANMANSTNPTSATLSNTVPGYTTPDGEFQFAAVNGSVNDWALFSYQVPVGFKRIIYGISISTVSIGALGSAITPTVIRWALGINSSAASLATVDGAGTWAPRRKPLGIQTFGLSTAIGAQANDISRSFTVPFVVNSARFLTVIAQIPVGVATASQLFRGTVTLNSYDE